MTGQNVTECTGGARTSRRPTSPASTTRGCDPRLNAGQALELAFMVAGLLKREREAQSTGQPKKAAG